MSLPVLVRTLNVIKVIAAAATKRFSSATAITRNATLIERTAIELLSDPSTSKLGMLTDELPQVKTFITSLSGEVKGVEKTALEAAKQASEIADNAATAVAFYQEKIAGKVGLSATREKASDPILTFLENVATNTKLYAETEQVAAKAATNLVKATQAVQDSVETLSQYLSRPLNEQSFAKIETLVDEAIATVEELYEAALSFGERSEDVVFASRRLANAVENEASWKSLLEALSKSLAEKVPSNIDLAAGTYEQVSLDGTGIAGLIALGIIVAPTVNQYLVKPVVDPTMRYVVKPTLSSIDNYVVQPGVKAAQGIGSTVKEAASITSFPAAQKIKLNDEEVLSPKFVSYSRIPDQKSNSREKNAAVWAAAAGKPAAKAENFTPINNYTPDSSQPSDLVYESHDLDYEKSLSNSLASAPIKQATSTIKLQ